MKTETQNTVPAKFCVWVKKMEIQKQEYIEKAKFAVQNGDYPTVTLKPVFGLHPNVLLRRKRKAKNRAIARGNHGYFRFLNKIF